MFCPNCGKEIVHTDFDLQNEREINQFLRSVNSNFSRMYVCGGLAVGGGSALLTMILTSEIVIPEYIQNILMFVYFILLAAWALWEMLVPSPNIGEILLLKRYKKIVQILVVMAMFVPILNLVVLRILDYQNKKFMKQVSEQLK
jgi:hypothetical protein